ncbi:MAG: leucyl aminopeptidase [Gemmatimonadales bacterium]|nr:leucyl aminopeptidase [Gemmatimonadales bacterium]
MTTTAIRTDVVAGTPEGAVTPFLAVLLAKGALPPSVQALDAAAGGALARAVAAGDFHGRKDELLLLHPPSGATRLLLVGLGPAEGIGPTALRRGAAAAAKRARVLGATQGHLWVAPEARGGTDIGALARAVAEGLPYGAWFDRAFKRPPEEPKPELEAMTLLVAPDELEAARSGFAIGQAIGAGQVFTRGLQVLPGNVCTPTFLGETAKDLAARHGFGLTVLDKAAIVAEGMGALLAVAQGSAEEPRFIALEYRGAEGAPVVLVGKGVTFDSGGISIKPADRMEDMKFDMSGAAAVLGTFEALGRLRPAAHVVGLIPATENMPSGTAVKPGDVLTSHLGKTIEMINTDAEGRLILCDALSYARRYAPAAVIDIATLTGAIGIALGQVAAGVMGSDDALVEEVRQAGERAGERCWPLPLWDDYRDLMKSDIADVKNAGGRAGGSISAGWFLREFVDGFPWAHLDIAATAYSDREDATRVKGPTGIGVRLFSEFILSRSA